MRNGWCRSVYWTLAIAAVLICLYRIAVIRVLDNFFQASLQNSYDDERSSAAVSVTTSTLNADKIMLPGGLSEISSISEANSPKEANVAPTHSTLPFSLVGTAITVPSRDSLCLLRLSGTKSTKAYRIGDWVMDARIYEITKERVSIEREGRIEYIDATRLEGMSAVGAFIPEVVSLPQFGGQSD